MKGRAIFAQVLIKFQNEYVILLDGRDLFSSVDLVLLLSFNHVVFVHTAKQAVPFDARRVLRHAAEHQVRVGSQPLRQLRYASVAGGRSQKIQVI